MEFEFEFEVGFGLECEFGFGVELKFKFEFGFEFESESEFEFELKLKFSFRSKMRSEMVSKGGPKWSPNEVRNGPPKATEKDHFGQQANYQHSVRDSSLKCRVGASRGP